MFSSWLGIYHMLDICVRGNLWLANCSQESLASKGYKFLRIDGTTKASDRVKIVDVSAFQKLDWWQILLMLICLFQIIFISLLFSGFSRRYRGSYISSDIPSWWSRPYTYKSRSCHCGWSCLEPKVFLKLFNLFVSSAIWLILPI